MNVPPLKRVIGFTLLVATCVILGFLSGYYMGTGSFPSLAGKSILPPETAVLESGEVTAILDEMPKQKYTEGYNCIDYTWDAVRELHWAGQPASIAALVYEGSSPNHAVLLVPTTNKGWILIEPQNGAIIKPHVGGFYSGHRIEAIIVLVFNWMLYDDFTQDPIWEELE